jgi:hypothetical protein
LVPCIVTKSEMRSGAVGKKEERLHHWQLADDDRCEVARAVDQFRAPHVANLTGECKQDDERQRRRFDQSTHRDNGAGIAKVLPETERCQREQDNKQHASNAGTL